MRVPPGSGELRRRGFTVACQRCGQVSAVGAVELLVYQLPFGAWVPRGPFDWRMTCPACRRRAWCSVTARRR